MSGEPSVSDGASVPWIIRLLDWKARAIRNSAAYRAIFDAHDEDYTRGGTEHQRLCADIRMAARMLDAGIEEEYAVTFFQGVQAGGQSHWRYTVERTTPGDQAP